MFKKLLIPLALWAAVMLPTAAQATILFPTGGGTGSSTLSGILIGNGVAPVNSLIIGTGLSLTGTTLAATGGSGSSTFGTTSISATSPLIWNTSTANLSLGTVPIANGGTNETSQITNSVGYFDGTGLTTNADLTFNPIGFGSTYPELTVGNAPIPAINLQTTASTDDGNGPVIFFSGPSGPIWQFYMPSLSQGFGSFNRVLFQYAIYSSLNNDTVLGATTGATPPTIGSRLVIKGQDATSAHSGLNVTDSSNNSLFFVRDDGAVTVSSLSTGLVKSTSGVLGNATAGTDYVNGSGTSGDCVQWGTSNSLTDTGSACGTGSGGVTSLTATLPLKISGSTGAVTISTLFSTTTNSGMAQGFQYVGSGGIFQTAASSSLFGFTPQPAGTYVTAVNGTANQITSSGGTTPTLSLPNHVIFPIDYVASAGSTTNATTTNFAIIGAAGNCNGTNALTTNSIGVVGCTAQPQGTVTAVSVATANGFAGSSGGGATPALTLTTTITGLLKGNGTAISAAANGTDYTLLTANTCGAGQFFNSATAAGVLGCGTPAGTTYTGTFPIQVTGSVISSLFSTTTNSGMTQGFQYVGSGGIFQTAATGTISNGTGISVTAGQSIIGSGLTITNTGVTSLSNGTGTTCSGTAPGTCNINTTQNITTLSNLTVAGFVQTTSGGALSSAALTSGQVTTALGFTPLSAALTSFGDGFATSTGPVIGLATSTASFNGLTVADAITNVGATFTITPLWSGTLNNAGLTNSSVTINTGTGLSGGGAVSLGGTALSLTNTGVTSIVAGTNVTISGSTGAVTINSTASGGGGTFPFTPLTNFGVNTSATSTPIWAQLGLFASSTSQIASTTFAINGNVGISTSSPSAQLTVASKASADQTPAFVIDGATGSFNADMQLNRGSNTGTEEANIDFATAGTVNYQLGIQNNSTSDFELWDGSNDPVLTVKNGTNNIGFGSSTPFGDFAINADFGDVLPGNLIFNVASSSATATTSVFQINNIGQVVLPLITGTQCLHAISGIVSGTGSDCGSGGGSSFAYPFTPSTDGGINTSATTTAIEGAASGLGLDVPTTSWFGIGGRLFAYGSTTNQDTILGLGAGGINATTSATVLGMTTVGYQSLAVNTGARNTALGYQALNVNTSATDNIGIGYQALSKTTSGSQNIAIGAEAGLTNAALGANTTGTQNIAIGPAALQSGTTDVGDVAIGFDAQFASASANKYNTSLGYQAGYNITTGSDNISLGAATTSSNANITTGSQNILIGDNISIPVATASGQLDIQNIIFGTGNSKIGTGVSTGNIGIATTTPWRTFSVNGTVSLASLTTSVAVQAGTLCLSSANEVLNESVACGSSALRYKQDIVNDSPTKDLQEVMQLQPVTYLFKADFNGALQNDPNYSRQQLGLIADAAIKVNPGFGKVETATTTFEGKTYAPGAAAGLDDEGIIEALVGALQAQQGEISALKPAAKTAEDNWQWGAIALLVLWNIALTVRRKK